MPALKLEHTYSEVTLEDVKKILTEMLQKPTPARVVTGVGGIMQFDDGTFVAWCNGLMPDIKCYTGMEGLKRIDERYKKLTKVLNS